MLSYIGDLVAYLLLIAKPSPSPITIGHVMISIYKFHYIIWSL